MLQEEVVFWQQAPVPQGPAGWAEVSFMCTFLGSRPGSAETSVGRCGGKVDRGSFCPTLATEAVARVGMPTHEFNLRVSKQRLVAVAKAHAEDVLGLQIHRQQHNRRIGGGQSGWDRGLSDDARDLSNA